MSEADPASSTAVAVKEEQPPRGARPKRPLSVTLVVLLAFGVAVYSLVYGVFDVLSDERHRMAVGAFRLAVGVGAVVACIGGLWLKSWAWTVFMTWAVVTLTHQILRVFFFGDPSYADLAIATVAVFALSPLEVQIAFGLRHTQNVELARATRNPIDRD